jgi:predicted ATPase
VREEGSAIANRLAAMLAGKHLLLVLDNFERVVDAASFVADLLARAPGVKVLTTSRIPLHAYGEREFPLPPFPMPNLAHSPSVEALSQYDAVRLFIDRGQAVRPDFVVTTTNAPAVAEICHRLDGLPLAIELAAAFVKMLPPQALLKRLDQRLPLLAGGARTLPSRQQTMRDTIAWSHDSLTPEEQTLFRRFAVFPGGCTIEAAEAVASREGTLDVFRGMTSLVDKSLLRQEVSAAGDPRFRMLETVREFGQERLEASGEAEETQRRLANWCLSLAEEAQPDPFGGTLPQHWVVRLHEELPNLRAAITWLLDHGEATKVLRLLAATEDYWGQQYLSDMEVRRWLATALAAAPDAPAPDRALAHTILAATNAQWGHGEEAGVYAQQALIAAQESGDPRILGMAQYVVGVVWDWRGDFGQAAAAYADAIPFHRAAGSEALAWYVQGDLADKLILSGDLEAGVPMLDEALTRLRQTSSDWFVIITIAQRGFAALRQGDLPGAGRWFTETIAQARRLQQTRSLLSGVTGLAGVALARDQAHRAARLLGAVEAAREALALGFIHNPHHAARMAADTRAALEPAAFERAWETGRLLPLDEAVAEALTVANEVLTQVKGGTARESASG